MIASPPSIRSAPSSRPLILLNESFLPSLSVRPPLAAALILLSAPSLSAGAGQALQPATPVAAGSARAGFEAAKGNTGQLPQPANSAQPAPDYLPQLPLERIRVVTRPDQVDQPARLGRDSDATRLPVYTIERAY